MAPNNTKIIPHTSGRQSCPVGYNPTMRTRNFSKANAQQAPSCPGGQATEPPVQTASRIAHEKNGGTIFQRKASAITVSRELNHPLNRFFRNQPMTPTVVRGGGRSGIGLKINTSIWVDASGELIFSPFDNGHFGIKPIHDRGNK